MSRIGDLRAAGFRGVGLQRAIAVSRAESGMNPKAHNPNAATGDNSYGLFQINMLGGMGPERRARYGLKSNEDLYNPLTNAKVAYDMSKGGTDWSAWSTWKNGAAQKLMGNGTGKAGGSQAPYGGSSPSSAGVSSSGSQDTSNFRNQLMNFMQNQAIALSENRPAPSPLKLIKSISASKRGVSWGEWDDDPSPQRKVVANNPTTTPNGSSIIEYLKEGTGGPTHSTGPHDHIAFGDPGTALATIKYAQSLGLRVGENPYTDPVDPVHVPGSYHDRTFKGKYNGRTLGQAADITGSADAIAKWEGWVKSRYGKRPS